MRHDRRMARVASRILLALPVVLVYACSSPEPQPAPPPENVGATASEVSTHVPVCPGPAAAGDARCHARVWVDGHGNPAVTSGPTGLSPADLKSAYNLTGLSG